jgi:hypothetical protein
MIHSLVQANLPILGTIGAGSSAVECALRKCKVVGSNPTQSTNLMREGTAAF